MIIYSSRSFICAHKKYHNFFPCARKIWFCVDNHSMYFKIMDFHWFSSFDHFHWFLGCFLTKMAWFFWTYDKKSQKNQRKNKNFTFLMRNSKYTRKIDHRNTSKHYLTIIFILLFWNKKKAKKKSAILQYMLDFRHIFTILYIYMVFIDKR